MRQGDPLLKMAGEVLFVLAAELLGFLPPLMALAALNTQPHL